MKGNVRCKCLTPNRGFMREAMRLARVAARAGEVPVGAVVVREGRIIGRGRNRIVKGHDPSAHAEMLAIREAAHRTGSERLPGCTLYSTLEPCAMCAGAIVLARLDRVVYGARDPKTGACGSVFNIATDRRLNHRAAVRGGLLARESGALLKAFFRKRRH